MFFYCVSFFLQKSGAAFAKKKIGLSAEKTRVAESKQADVLAVANNKQILYFEDGLKYYAAINAKCTCIVTEDLGDFHFSEIVVLNAESLLTKPCHLTTLLL